MKSQRSPRYRLSRVGAFLGGITSPRRGAVGAVLKFNGAESPYCVFNEIVALRLARAVGAPVADGVIAANRDHGAFASLEVTSSSLSLPPLRASQLAAVAARYQREVALLLAFDTWIGNLDRGLNFRAVLVPGKRGVFCAYDHSHCLLNIEATPALSIEKLRSREFFSVFHAHPFRSCVNSRELDRAFEAIAAVPEQVVSQCTDCSDPLARTPAAVQAELASALYWRARALRKGAGAQFILGDRFNRSRKRPWVGL